jgi:hypothetical protein
VPHIRCGGSVEPLGEAADVIHCLLLLRGSSNLAQRTAHTQPDSRRLSALLARLQEGEASKYCCYCTQLFVHTERLLHQVAGLGLWVAVDAETPPDVAADRGVSAYRCNWPRHAEPAGLVGKDQ